MKRMRKKNFDLKEGTMIYRQNGETYEVLRYNKYYSLRAGKPTVLIVG